MAWSTKDRQEFSIRALDSLSSSMKAILMKIAFTYLKLDNYGKRHQWAIIFCLFLKICLS